MIGNGNGSPRAEVRLARDLENQIMFSVEIGDKDSSVLSDDELAARSILSKNDKEGRTCGF